MLNFKFIYLLLCLTLISCSQKTIIEEKQNNPKGYLKVDITQAELQNSEKFKRYYYTCQNLENLKKDYLTTYFPLWKESRLSENFGIYFQLNGRKAEPFDHIENRSLNTKKTRFEVIYRSYQPIDNFYIELVAKEYYSIYYKNQNGKRKPWLKCQES